MNKLSKRQISAGIVPVRKVGDQYLFLLLRAYSNWDFPKGGVEKGESFLETALRETLEETTLSKDDLNFKWGKFTKESEPYKKGNKVAIYFIAETQKEKVDLPVNPEIGKPEHDEFRWVSYNEASELVNKRIQKILDWANKIILK